MTGKLLTFPGGDKEKRLRLLREELRQLEAHVPEDEESEAFEAWADAHEAIEDEIDDILDEE